MQRIKPLLRAANLARLKWQARAKVAALRPDNREFEASRMAFIVGCGRSGTTILGKALGCHPQVRYLNEPRHLWAAVDSRTDVTNLYGGVDAHYFMDSEHCTPSTMARFRHLIARPTSNAEFLTLEKTPHNVARLGFLEALTSDARYVHIVRNGLDVARSIGRIATANEYKIAGRTRQNQWWGLGGCKWRILVREAAARGYYPAEVGLLADETQKGVYEWLVSLGEAERWRTMLAGRFIEITYTELTSHPMQVLRTLSSFLELGAPGDWLRDATRIIHPERHQERSDLHLPPSMRQQFNHHQQHWGFAGRAAQLLSTPPSGQPSNDRRRRE